MLSRVVSWVTVDEFNDGWLYRTESITVWVRWVSDEPWWLTQWRWLAEWVTIVQISKLINTGMNGWVKWMDESGECMNAVVRRVGEWVDESERRVIQQMSQMNGWMSVWVSGGERKSRWVTLANWINEWMNMYKQLWNGWVWRVNTWEWWVWRVNNWVWWVCRVNNWVWGPGGWVGDSEQVSQLGGWLSRWIRWVGGPEATRVWDRIFTFKTNPKHESWLCASYTKMQRLISLQKCVIL